MNPLLRDITLCRDLIFRSVFGRETMKKELTSLLNAILVQAGLPRVVSLKLKNPFSLPRKGGCKTTIFDVAVTDETGRSFDLEMQTYNERDLIPRSIFYAARGLSESLGAGESYSKLRPYYVVVFTRFPIPRHSENSWFDAMQMTSTLDPSQRYDLLTTIYVRLPQPGEKIPKNAFTDDLDAWVRFLTLRMTEQAKYERLVARNPIFKSIAAFMREYFIKENVRMWLSREQLYEIDQRSAIEAAAADGKEEGLKEGLKEGKKEGKREGLKEGKKEGKAEGNATAIEGVLSSRFPEDYAPFAASVRSGLSTKTLPELERLIPFCATCSSVPEFVSLL